MKTHTTSTSTNNTNNTFLLRAMRRALLTFALTAGLLSCPDKAQAGIYYVFDTVQSGESWSGGEVAQLTISENRECKNVSVNWKSATPLKELPLG
jgi:hypothetical protein